MKSQRVKEGKVIRSYYESCLTYNGDSILSV